MLPDEVKMKSYWLWLNGQVTKESITGELEGMKSKGYGGAVICDAFAAGENTPKCLMVLILPAKNGWNCFSCGKRRRQAEPGAQPKRAEWMEYGRTNCTSFRGNEKNGFC